MAFNPMDFFTAGGELGKSSVGPFNYGASNIMDRFNAVNDAGMKMALQAQLFKGEKNYEWSNSPQSREASAKLNASGFGPQGGGSQSGGLAQVAGVGGPSAGGLGNNVPTDFTSVTGQKFENQQANVNKAVIQKQLDQSSTDANGAALMIQKLDEIRGLHDKALQSVKRASVSNTMPLGLATRVSQGRQAVELAGQGPNNPEWQNYEKAKLNFSYAADRGLFGEKGKLIAQQLNAGAKLFPTSSGTREGDEGLWNTLYSIPMKTIDYHNSIVDQYGADPSIKIKPSSRYLNPLTSASKSSPVNPEIKQKYAEALAKYPGKRKAILAKFKQDTGVDYDG